MIFCYYVSGICLKSTIHELVIIWVIGYEP